MAAMLEPNRKGDEASHPMECGGAVVVRAGRYYAVGNCAGRRGWLAGRQGVFAPSPRSDFLELCVHWFGDGKIGELGVAPLR